MVHLSHLSLLLNDGVSPDQLSIFVLDLFPTCLYRGMLVEIFELKHRREYH